MGEAASPRGSLQGQHVAITGRLASMARADAVRAIADAGGHYVDDVTDATALLVLGQDGWPLREDGQWTRALLRAHELAERGAGIEILPESTFLARLGLEQTADDDERMFTTGELCRMLSITARQLRTWIRTGLVRPKRTIGRMMSLDFAQVASARALHQLTSRGATAPQVRRSLTALRRWLPDAEHSLAQLEAKERGGPLMVRLQDGRLAEPSGQLHFDFENEQEPRGPEPLRLASRRPGQRTSDDWFRAGLSAEAAGQLEEAARAYHQALRVGEPNAEIAFSFGNVLYALDRKGEAAQRYMQAVEIDSEYAEAWNNLGNAIAEQGRLDDAIEAYESALLLDPSYGDVHYNLAETLAQQGRAGEARPHWQAYLAHDPHSEWADTVRRHLARDADAVAESNGC